jgi:hypothetical protein
MTKRVMVCLFLLSSISIAQSSYDSTAPGYRKYSSFGFNASLVSGVGLSYRSHLQGPSLVQFTAGVLSGGGSTFSSLGFAYQYQLSRKDNFRYYIATGAGLYTSGTSRTVIGFGIGLEVPGIGTTIFESVTAGGELYYPAFYLGPNPSVGVGGSLYIYFNF